MMMLSALLLPCLFAAELPTEPLPLNHWSTSRWQWTGYGVTGPTIGHVPYEDERWFGDRGKPTGGSLMPEDEVIADLARQVLRNHGFTSDVLERGRRVAERLGRAADLYGDLCHTFRAVVRRPLEASEYLALFAHQLEKSLSHSSKMTLDLIQSLDYVAYHLAGLRFDPEVGLRTDRLRAVDQQRHGEFTFARLMGAVIRHDHARDQIHFVAPTLVFCHGCYGIGGHTYEVRRVPGRGRFLVLTELLDAYGKFPERWIDLDDPRIGHDFEMRTTRQPDNYQAIYFKIVRPYGLDEDFVNTYAFTDDRPLARANLATRIESNLRRRWVARCGRALTATFGRGTRS